MTHHITVLRCFTWQLVLGPDCPVGTWHRPLWQFHLAGIHDAWMPSGLHLSLQVGCGYLSCRMLQAKKMPGWRVFSALSASKNLCLPCRWADSLAAELVAGATARPLLSGYYRVAAVLLRLAEAGGLLLSGGGGRDGAKPGDTVQDCALAQVRQKRATPSLRFYHPSAVPPLCCLYRDILVQRMRKNMSRASHIEKARRNCHWC